VTASELLVQVLLSDRTLSGLVAKRVYADYAPQLPPDQLYPCVVYKRVSFPHLKTLSGNAKTYYPRYTLSLLSLRSKDCEAMLRRVVSLEGQRTESDGPVTLRWLWVEDGRNDADKPQEMDEQAVRELGVDVVLWYDDTGA